MTSNRDIEVVLDQWLAERPIEVAERVLDDVADRIGRQSQRPGWSLRWQRPQLRAGIAAAAVIVLLIVAFVAVALIGGSQPITPPVIRPALVPDASASQLPSATTRVTPPAAIGPGRIVLEAMNTTMPNELRYIAPDLRALPMLPDFGGHQRTAAWRPDGERLAFAGRPDGHPDQWMDLYESDPNGTSLKLLSTDCELPTCVEETDPAYSPDGTRLVAVRLADLRDDAPTRSVLVIYDLASGRATEVPNSSFPYDTHDIGHPRWSPDGTQIVFHIVEGPPSRRRQLIFPEPTSPGPSSIHVIGTDGSGLRQLTPDGLAAGDPDWSPDGSIIVFGSTPKHLWLYGQDESDWGIRSIRPDGSLLREVIAPDGAITPSWTADGDRILFAGGSGTVQAIRTAAPDGSDVEVVANFRSSDVLVYPVEQPTP